MRICILYSGEFGRKVIGNLVNQSGFCVSCGDLCDQCRRSRPSAADQIVGIYEIPQNLPEFIEEPEEYLPAMLPECDLLIAMDLHPDLLTGLPDIAEKAGISGVIVPVEQHRLGPPGIIEKVRKDLESKDIDCEFPRAFCSLEKCGKPVIDRFVEMGFGKPVLRIQLNERKDHIVAVDVITDAPCGSTCFVARKLRGTAVKEYKETVSSAHHAYPCTAGMEIDPQIGDTILHRAGYIIRNSVEDALED